jgi:tryptophan synthase alpha chain
MTFALGLTGGIGSGKSTVSRLLRDLGAQIVDADAIVHDLQAPGAAMLDEIAEAFGSHVIDADGALDRAAVADIVFRDPDARKTLGLIVHGPVGLEMLVRETRGFLYYVSLTGVTGARSNVAEGVPEEVRLAQSLGDVPVCVGFGISTPEHAKEVAGYADGVIVGSAIVDRIEASSSARQAVVDVADFVASLKEPLRG